MSHALNKTQEDSSPELLSHSYLLPDESAKPLRVISGRFNCLVSN